MFKMKRYFESFPNSLVIITKALAITLLMVGQSHAKTLSIFACEPELASLAEAVGGKHVKVVSATSASQDPHYIEARPALISRARSADLVVCTGAELEIGWLPLILSQSGNRDIQPGTLGYFAATDSVDLIEIPETIDRSSGDVHSQGNPHVLFDPDRLLVIAEALSKRLQVTSRYQT